MDVYKKIFNANMGEFYDINHYDKIIKENCIGFKEDGQVLFCCIKDAIPKEDRDKYKDVIRKPAKAKTKNRGQSAGAVDIKYFPKRAVVLCDKNGNEFKDNKKRFSVFYKDEKGKVVNRCQSNQVRCGVAGHFDKVAGFPCRKVGWSRDNLDKHNILGELANEIQKNHKEFCYTSYLYHKIIADKRPAYLFKDSIYSTMTLNYDFRTATHKDTGDLHGGLSTLTIFEDEINNYEGFYLGLPDYKIAFDLRDGDLLIFDAHEKHANTEYKVLSDKLPIDDITKTNFAGRIAVVCYLRNRLKECPIEIPKDDRFKSKKQKIAEKNKAILLSQINLLLLMKLVPKIQLEHTHSS